MPLSKDQLAAYHLRLAAAQKGYKFIELRFNDDYEHIVMSPARVHGVIDIRGVPTGVKRGRPTYQIRIVKNGVLTFEFDDDKGEFVAWMLWDKEPGAFSETSYNLDLITTHNKNSIWHVHDYPAVMREVKKRLKLAEEIIAKNKAKKIRLDAKRKAEQDRLHADTVGAEKDALKERLNEIEIEEGVRQKKEGAPA